LCFYLIFILSLPLYKKNKRGPKPKRKTAREGESMDNLPITPDVIQEIELDSEDEEAPNQPPTEPTKKKRGRPPGPSSAAKIKRKN
jgi:hypothetical protein